MQCHMSMQPQHARTHHSSPISLTPNSYQDQKTTPTMPIPIAIPHTTSHSLSPPPPLPLPLPPGLQLHKPHLLQPLRQRRRIPHPWEILRRIHTKRLRPRLRQDWHRLPRILHAAPVHESELKSVESRRAHGEIGEDEECRGDFGVFVRLWSCFSV